VLTVTSTGNQGGGTTVVITKPLTVSTLAGQALVSGSVDGAGIGARFYFPAGCGKRTMPAISISRTLTITPSARFVAATGSVTTLAGLAGVSGSADGVGSQARFDNPSDVAVDGPAMCMWLTR